MQKQAPSLPRIGAMVIFALSCFGLLLFLWLSFGGPSPLKPKKYEFNIALDEAGRLGEQADVRMSGVVVGKVTKKKRAANGNQTIATVALDREYAPIPKDAHAILRQKTLLGETYVELTRGTPGAGTVPEGGLLAQRNVEPTVELDELLDTFDPMTRQAYRSLQREMAASVRGRGQDLNDALGNLPAFVESGGDLLAVLDDQRGALQALVRNTGVVFEALTVREDQLRNLIVNGERVFAAIDSQRESFAQIWQIFPTFLEENRLTYDRLAVFATETRPLARELRPAADELGPTLRAVGDFGPDLRRLFINLDPLLDAQEESLPALRQLLRGFPQVLRAFGPWMAEVGPFLEWIGIHSHTLADMFANLGGATAATTLSGDPRAPGHYLRQVAPSGDEAVAMAANRVPDNRGNAYINPLGLTNPNQGRHAIIGAWDCGNVGGPKPATPGATGSPACWIAETMDFNSEFPFIRRGRFPRIGRASYSSNDSFRRGDGRLPSPSGGIIPPTPGIPFE